MHRYGLIGKNISYSFSRAYFREKFEALGLKDHLYENFDLPDLAHFPLLLEKYPDLKGLNVTIPYKEQIIDYLDELDPAADAIGAVNTIAFGKGGLKGFNTDVIGFKESLKPLLTQMDREALILGTGGASKAVFHGLEALGLKATYVSRQPGRNQLTYPELTPENLSRYQLIVNCTPVGTHPHTEHAPELPYGGLKPTHLLYDLIYNPAETRFLLEGKRKGCRIKNGLEMLQIQAEEAWKIWNS
ncbi:shikimate dehydrogenase family protein [Robiginitalea sp. IMCC43444]|uniref:shikimate dehydrogenase family protein n=1 Tax=Robiginitalea sp. IMCC43444 TaxID=3459121 RepID=UPI0040412320